MLISVASLLATAPPAISQPSEIDWRSTLILRFDPAAGGSAAAADGDYLMKIADGLESAWIAESGADAIAIGPIFPLRQRSESEIDYAAIDPSLGTADDWMRLTTAAQRANITVALLVRLPGSVDARERLAAWAAESGIRHFIVDVSSGADVAGGADISALRAALDAGLSGESWIAGVGKARRGAFDASGDAFEAGSGDALSADGDALEADSGTLEAGSGGDGAAQWGDARFDAIIETVFLEDLGDDAALGAFYRKYARQVASAPQPLVAAVDISTGSGQRAARVLMLPGALQVTASAAASDSSDLWRRIAAFRARHPSISRGEHVDLVNDTFAFARTATDRGMNDRVVVVLGASGTTTLNVSRIFPDNTMLLDALTGRTAFVSFGMATFEAGPSGVILVEEIY